MENETVSTAKIVFDCGDKAVESFLRRWMDSDSHVVAHTSGSTGVPKEIRLLKEDMLLSAKATCEFFNISEKSTLVSPLSCDYIAGKMMVVRALVSKSKLIIEKPSNSPTRELSERISLLPVVPSQLDYLIDNEDKLCNIDNLLIGGAALNRDVEQRLINLGVNAFVSYGMTETCSHVALRRIGEAAYKALPGISFATDNDSCLRIIAPKFSFKELQTNDVVNLIDGQTFQWIGRRDNAINSGGIKVFAESIEAKIEAVTGNSIRFYITSDADKKWGEVPVIVIEGSKIQPDRLNEIFSKNLSPAERPKRIIMITRLPLTETGKIRRLKPDQLELSRPV